MAVVLSDPSLHAFIGGAPATPPALRSRYRRMVAGPADSAVSWCNWVIRLRDEGCLVGTVQATISPSEEAGLTATDQRYEGEVIWRWRRSPNE
jgi:hypothetical protein